MTINKPLSILQVNRSDIRGGAAKIAWDLFQFYKKAGHKAFFAVDVKLTDNPDVLVIPNKNEENTWIKFWTSIQQFLVEKNKFIPGLWKLSGWLNWVSKPKQAYNKFKGIENFQFPGTKKILKLTPELPDVIHLHVLHGGYFDLAQLPYISNATNTFITLHDAWLLSGHCAHSFDCNRWITGCGNCPDLTVPPAVLKDSTAFNWKRKKDIYSRSKLYVATPSKWLMDKVHKSILMEGAVETKVIYNGIDTSVFKPGNKTEAREKLNLPVDKDILLFTANGIRKNRWKNYSMLREAIKKAAQLMHDRNILFLALGENAEAEFYGNTEIRFQPYVTDSESIVNFYRASDIYLHASKADTFPTAIIEALACGTPVIGTDVGGIPEQIKGLKDAEVFHRLNIYGESEATGYLVENGDSESMAKAIKQILTNPRLKEKLNLNTASDAASRFNLKREAEEYMNWYYEVLEKTNKVH